MNCYLAVITPVYATPENNRVRYFEDTAASVLAQDIDFLWLIVNDGSTDPRMSDFLSGIHDNRVKVLNRQRRPRDIKTASNALNLGFNYALAGKPTHFAYVHSDDLLTKDSLEHRLNAIEDRDMIFGRMAFCDEKKAYQIRTSVYNNGENSIYSSFPHHTSMWAKEMIEKLITRRRDLFDPNVSFGEDLDLTLSSMNLISGEGYRLGFLDDIVYIHINHSLNITAGTSSESINRQIKYVFDKNGYAVPKPSTSVTLSKVFRNPGFFLPENIRKIFHPYKAGFSRMTGGFLFPETTAKVSINPFWFKHLNIQTNDTGLN